MNDIKFILLMILLVLAFGKRDGGRDESED